MTTHTHSRVAVHEAGHAAVCFARGIPVHVATVVADDGGAYLGRVGHGVHLEEAFRSEEPNWPRMVLAGRTPEEVEALVAEWGRTHRPDPEGHAAVCAAGEVAERIAFGSVDDEATLEGDRRGLAGLCFYLGRDDRQAHRRIEADAYALAEQILRDRWPAVLALAAALEERKTLSGAEVEAVLRGVPVGADE